MFKRVLLFSIFVGFGLLGIIIYQKLTLDDGKLRIVFCDVGEGDAIFIRTPSGQDLLIDGGPDDKVLNCLGKHMPFWDRSLELVILTHPQADHLTGLISVMKSYSISQFVSASAAGMERETEVFKQLKNGLTKKKIKTLLVKAGDRFKISDGPFFEIVWPPENLIVGEINELSVVVLLSYGEFETLLTGDIKLSLIDELALSESKYRTVLGEVEGIEVLKVPHHGSRTGISEDSLDKVRPRLAVISVGKNNPFSHPHSEVMKILRDRDIKTLRTDIDGEVEVVSDGKKWEVKTRR